MRIAGEMVFKVPSILHMLGKYTIIWMGHSVWLSQGFADLVRISRTVTTFSKQARFVTVSQFDFYKIRFVRLSFHDPQDASFFVAFETEEHIFLSACLHTRGSVCRPEESFGCRSLAITHLVFVRVSH